MIAEFIDYIRYNRRYSENTQMSYARDLTYFARWLRSHKENARWSLVTQADIENYIAELSKDAKKASTICRKIACLRTFYNWQRARGYNITENPARYVQKPKMEHGIPYTIEPEAIWKAITATETPMKTKCMLSLLIETGVRISELLAMETKDFNPTERSIKVKGKGAKWRTVYYGDISRKYLNTYVGWRKGKIFDFDQREARRLTEEALRPYSQQSQLSPHALRHTFATSMLANGAPLKSIAELLGHESVKTTEMYAHAIPATAKRDYQQYARPLRLFTEAAL